MSEAVPERYPAPRRPGMLGTIVITLVVLALGLFIFGYSPAMLVALYAGLAAIIVAVPYTVIAIVAREVTARRRPADGAGEHRQDALEFAMFRQRASLVNAIAMLVALVIAVLVARPWEAADGYASPLDGITTLGSFALVAGVFAIVVNIPSIYSRRVVQAERHAIRERTGAWKLILTNTIVTTASWIAYCGFAIFYLNASF